MKSIVPDTFETPDGYIIFDPVTCNDLPKTWKRLGEGSSRVAYLMKCGLVIKVNCHRPFLKDQCKTEGEVWANACEQLRPHLAKLYAAGKTFTVMEYVPQILRSYSDPRIDTFRANIQNLLKTGLIDVGASNVGVRTDGSVCLVDYGYY